MKTVQIYFIFFYVIEIAYSLIHKHLYDKRYAMLSLMFSKHTHLRSWQQWILLCFCLIRTMTTTFPWKIDFAFDLQSRVSYHFHCYKRSWRTYRIFKLLTFIDQLELFSYVSFKNPLALLWGGSCVTLSVLFFIKAVNSNFIANLQFSLHIASSYVFGSGILDIFRVKCLCAEERSR